MWNLGFNWENMGYLHFNEPFLVIKIVNSHHIVPITTVYSLIGSSNKIILNSELQSGP